jgi:hypothetical protein
MSLEQEHDQEGAVDGAPTTGRASP